MRNDFSEKYIVEEEIGRGRFGRIHLCSHLRSSQRLACKIISKADLRDSLDKDSVRTEIAVLKYLAGHRGIVELHDVYEDEECVRLVMDLCADGDLYDRIIDRNRFGETEAADVLKRVMEAVDFCHRKGVAHRDLKPDNILFSDNLIKVADFGQASFFSAGERMRGIVGTPYYVAPEVLEGREYNEKVDVWSAGVILYVMLSGGPPFGGETPQQIFEAVVNGRLRFPNDPWLTISRSAKDLIRRMLCRDVESRFTAEDVLGHPWIRENCG